MRIEAYTQVQSLYNTKKAARIQAKSKAGFSDQLQLSSMGRDMQVAKQAVAGSGDIREDLVASVKARIQSGTYDVSAEQLADKLYQKYTEMR